MTIGDHCLETLRAHVPELGKNQARQRVLETLEAVRIPPNRWQQYPHEFSGGMRQRVAIALALLLNPRLIIADEPTTSLDVTVAAEILQELMHLCQAQGMALLLISHDLALVSEYCDRVAVMYNGEVVESGDTQTVLRSPQHEYTQSLLRSALILHQGSDHRSLSHSANRTHENGDQSPHPTDPTDPTDLTQPANQQNRQLSGPVLLRLDNIQQYFALEQNWLAQLLGNLLGKLRPQPPTSQAAPTPQRWIKAVDHISLDLYEGEILGLVGESGCGKSTLCRTLLRLNTPNGGQIEFAGQNLLTLSEQQLRQTRRQMQMVFQDPRACLNPHMTIGESIGDPLVIHNLAQGDDRKAQVLALLERVGLTPADRFYDYYPHQLSGGQQQRVGIARALITRPKLLVCDEPVSMLDATVQTQVLELMIELKQEFNLTYLFVTHDLGVARFFCDRVAVMTGGQIVEMGNTEAIFENPQHPYTRSLLKAAPQLRLSCS
jgi:peptide/nickel transport system ATP-binding protein